MCTICGTHTGTLYFGQCSGCRLKSRSRASNPSSAKKTSFVPKATSSQPSIVGLENEIISLQKKNALLQDRMADLEAQMALIVESVSEICTRNLEKMEEDLDG